MASAGGIVAGLIALGLFVAGAVLAVWATERLLEGLVSLAGALRLSAFAVGAVLSGFEAENVAVGLAARWQGTAPVALGTVFGGAIFLVCMALGLGALLFPLNVHVPRSVLGIFALSPLMTGLALIGSVTPRWAGALLLAAFAPAMVYLVRTSRQHQYLPSGELAEGQKEQHRLGSAVSLMVLGIVAIGLGGELVARGAERIVASAGVPALVMGMVVTPATIELEEVIRQAVPTREGCPDVSAGNLVGTLLFFVLFNLGLIALLTPVRVAPLVRQLDWPFLVTVTWITTAFLWRGRVGRGAGGLLLAAYALYAVLHVLLR
jgi:cation:H+ antiporter